MVVFLFSGCIVQQQEQRQEIHTPPIKELVSVIANHGMIVYDDIKDSVILIGDSTRPNGSAYFIGENTVVTCYHVVDGLDSIFIQFRTDIGTERTYELEIVGVSPIVDIAVLKFKEPPHRIIKPLKFRTNPVLIGQDVYLYGHPMMNMYFFSTGVVSKLNDNFILPYEEDLTIKYKAIYTDGFMGPGSSGGLMVDSQGDILGMTGASHMRYGIPVGMNVAIHVDELKTITTAILETPELYPMPVEPEPLPELKYDYEDEDYEDEGDTEEDEGDTEEEVLDKNSEEYKKAKEKAEDEALKRAEEKANEEATNDDKETEWSRWGKGIYN